MMDGEYPLISQYSIIPPTPERDLRHSIIHRSRLIHSLFTPYKKQYDPKTYSQESFPIHESD
jgi:hypothetical protein